MKLVEFSNKNLIKPVDALEERLILKMDEESPAHLELEADQDLPANEHNLKKGKLS